MGRSITLAFVFLTSTLSVMAENYPLIIWAAPEDYRLFPNESACVDFPSTKLSSLLQKNRVWNSNGEIHLKGARRETVAFQLILQHQAPQVDKIKIKATSLKNKKEFIPSKNIRFFLVGYVPEKGKYYPDILIPFDIENIHPFSIPHRIDKLAVVPEQKNQAVWVDVEIPEDMTAGTYQGNIKVEQDGKTLQILPLSLEVLDIDIPLERHAELIMDSYGSHADILGKGNEEKGRECEEKIYQLAHAHRTTLSPIPYPQNGKPRPAALPEINVREDGSLDFDWDSFDERFGKYFDGSAFPDRQPVEQFCLYFNIFWPAMAWPAKEHIQPSYKSPEKEKYEKAWADHARAFIKHFQEKKWTRTRFAIKMNHYKRKLVDNGIPLHWEADTPSQKDDFESVAYYANLVHRSFKNSAPVQFYFRMDTEHSFCGTAGCNDPSFDQNQAGKVMRPVDFWYFKWDHVFSHLTENKKLQKEGKRTYYYKHGLTPNHLSPEFRSLGWLLHAGHLDGYCMWNKIHNNLLEHRIDPEDPTEYSWENYAMYLADSLGYPGPIPTLRLKLWRSGLYDAEYIHLAMKKDPKAVAALASRLIQLPKPGSPAPAEDLKQPHLEPNPDSWSKAREALVEIIQR